jgi:ABC-type Na+ efflux pump permease subunit
MLAPTSPAPAQAGFTLARFVLVEAWRTRLPALVLVAAVAGIGLAGFLSQLALTESASLQAAVLAAFFRVTTVFLCAAFVVTSMVREANDKGADVLLSLPISRAVFYLGKMAGFGAFGVLVAAVFSLILLLWSPPLAVGAWFVSMSLEVWLVVSISLFFVVSLGDVITALSATGGLYLLGRTVRSLQSISTSPIALEDNFLSDLAGWGINAIALILPPLEHATQTNWLLYSPPMPFDFAQIAGGVAVYAGLATAAGLFDFHRRKL